MRKVLIGLAAGALALTGCGNNGSTTAKPPTTPVSSIPPADPGTDSSTPVPEEPTAPPTTGAVNQAVGKTVTYPDGLTIRFISAKRWSAKTANTHESVTPLTASQTLVTVRVKYENRTGHAIDYPSTPTVYYAAAGYTAESVCCFYKNLDAYDTSDLRFEDQNTPTRIPAGNTAYVWASYIVPTAYLGQVDATVSAPSSAQGYNNDFTFTNVGTVMTWGK